MVYNVIGLMSGSSLDGLDIAFVELTEVGGQWTFELKYAQLMEYDDHWVSLLKSAPNMSIPNFLNLHTAYGRRLGEMTNEFIKQNDLLHKVHFIASHGHTVFHDPENHTSFQLGDGATIAAITGLAVISDLRNKDVALGGQGAPIVPVAERLLWNDYDYCLNIGGIANVTINKDKPIAFDICPANQVLNFFANLLGKEYDENGALASSGEVDLATLEQLSSLEYYRQEPPKSLANTYSKTLINILKPLSPKDALATMSQHVADELKNALTDFHIKESAQLLITGGGAFNVHLVNLIRQNLPNIKVVTPEKNIIENKEAIAMTLIGALRWREEANVLSSVTGAKSDSVGGALWVN